MERCACGTACRRESDKWKAARKKYLVWPGSNIWMLEVSSVLMYNKSQVKGTHKIQRILSNKSEKYK